MGGGRGWEVNEGSREYCVLEWGDSVLGCLFEYLGVFVFASLCV